VSSKQSNLFFGSNRNKLKLNLFWLFFGLFRETKKTFFRFVSVCFGVSDRYRNNRNKQNFIETNRNKPIKSPKKFSISPRNRYFFFSVLTKPNRNSICSVVFRFAFRETNQIFSSLFQCFKPVLKKPKQTELMVWGIKKVDI
jgi:hypothetical protein